MIQIPNGPVVDENGATTSPFMHFFNNMAESSESVQATTFEDVEKKAQSVIDDVATKSHFVTFYDSKGAAGEFNHNLGDNYVKFSLMNYTATDHYEFYGTSATTLYTDFGDDTCFAWITNT